jgi:hypothetical protein
MKALAVTCKNCCTSLSRNFVTCFISYIRILFSVHSEYSEVFATCSKGDIRVWSTETSLELLRIMVANFTCTGIQFTCDGKSIVSGKCCTGYSIQRGKKLPQWQHPEWTRGTTNIHHSITDKSKQEEKKLIAHQIIVNPITNSEHWTVRELWNPTDIPKRNWYICSTAMSDKISSFITQTAATFNNCNNLGIWEKQFHQR